MIHLQSAPTYRPLLLLSVLAVLAGCLGGCATSTGQGPLLVSKPGMQFSEARVFNAASRIVLQQESGRVVSGGAQASVCTSCR